MKTAIKQPPICVLKQNFYNNILCQLQLSEINIIGLSKCSSQKTLSLQSSLRIYTITSHQDFYGMWLLVPDMV
jgi:hypothetical protein